jgi:hypothetical protein
VSRREPGAATRAEGIAEQCDQRENALGAVVLTSPNDKKSANRERPVKTPALIATVALFGLTGIVSAAEPAVPKNPPDPVETRAPDLRGTEQAPFVVTVAPSPAEGEERAALELEKRVQATNEARIVRATDFIAVGTLVLAAATILLWVYTYRLWKTSSEAARRSDEAAREQLSQFSRSATAMETVALATQNNAALFQQMLAKQARAYIAVLVGGAIYQERDKHLRFEGGSVLVNSGMTPAHRVRHRAQAAIMSHPLPADFDFPLPAEPDGGPILNPREQYNFRTLIADYVPDEEVPAIKLGDGKALYVWGVVAYDDAFGQPHETRFCHTFLWFGTGESERPQGYYDRRHNEAT